MSKKVFLPLSKIINAYKERHAPTKPHKNYKHYVAGLASELEGLNLKPWDFEAPEDYFQSYVYIYLNPLKSGCYEYLTPAGRLMVFDFEPFYVGKGKGERAYDHLKEVRNLDNQSHKCCTIRKIWAAAREPIIKISKSRMSDYTAQAHEIDWIAGIGRRDKKTGPLTNLTCGGGGVVDAVWSEESNRKRSISNTGKKRSLETRQNISKVQLGRKASAETRLKMSRSHIGLLTGIKQSVSHIAKLSAVRRGRKSSIATRDKPRKLHNQPTY